MCNFILFRPQYLLFELTPRPPLLEREGEQKPPSLCKRRGLGDEFKKVVHRVKGVNM
jgi:hypothetical protein